MQLCFFKLLIHLATTSSPTKGMNQSPVVKVRGGLGGLSLPCFDFGPPCFDLGPPARI